MLACAATALALVAVAGCGGDESAVWDGPPDPSSDGAVAVDGFGDYTADVEEHWEGSAAMSAAEFLRLDQRKAAKTTIAGRAAAEGTGPQVVIVTLDGLLDDSVRAERWTLAFEQDEDVYRLTEANWAQRCQPDRGHQDFTPDPCV